MKLKQLENDLENLKQKFISALKYGSEQEILNFLDLNNVKDLINIEIYKRKVKQPQFSREYIDIVETPLHIAVKRDYITIAKRLIELGASINAIDHFMNTPLHIAAYSINEVMVRLLISYNANLDLQNSEQDTPFFIACTFGLGSFLSSFCCILPESSIKYRTTSNIIKCLIHAGANISIKGADNVEPYNKLKSYNKAIYNTIEKELESYKIKKDSDISNAENLFKWRIDLAKTSLSELAIDKIINYLDSEKTFSRNTIEGLIKGAKEVFACRKIEQESRGKECNFERFYDVVKENSIRRIINSEDQQEYYRKSFYPKESFVELEDKKIIEHFGGMNHK